MNKVVTEGCMAVATFAAVAVPTKTELERAKPVVENMTTDGPCLPGYASEHSRAANL